MLKKENQKHNLLLHCINTTLPPEIYYLENCKNYHVDFSVPHGRNLHFQTCTENSFTQQKHVNGKPHSGNCPATEHAQKSLFCFLPYQYYHFKDSKNWDTTQFLIPLMPCFQGKSLLPAQNNSIFFLFEHPIWTFQKPSERERNPNPNLFA